MLRIVLFGAALLVAAIPTGRAQVPGGFDHITGWYEDGTSVFVSFVDSGSTGYYTSVAQPWTATGTTVAHQLSCVWGTFQSAVPPDLLPSEWRVNIWSSLDAMTLQPLAGDVLSLSLASPDQASFDASVGYNSITGANFEIGFDLPAIPLIAGHSYYFGVHGKADFFSHEVGGLVESSALAGAAVEVADYGTGQNVQTVDVYGGTLHEGTVCMRLEADLLHIPWVDTGNGLAGTGVLGFPDDVPRLYGEGDLLGGDSAKLHLSNAIPSSTTHLVMGFGALNAPLKGGVLVPTPDILIFNLHTDSNGRLSIETTWPSAIPVGVELWFQTWVNDPAGPVGFAASNGLLATTP